MYNRAGVRCKICTGCGLCAGVKRAENKEVRADFYVLTDEGTKEKDEISAKREFGYAPVQQNKDWLAVVDLGTTTVAMLLYQPSGEVADRFVAVNPQVEYGRDVISRISAAEEEKNAKDMQEMVQHLLEKGLTRFQEKVPFGGKMQVVLAGNTTMIYLLMGWKPRELGQAPFHASYLEATEVKLFEQNDWNCYVLPGISAFVGADILAGIYACNMHSTEQIVLLIDLGTNGEMVLGNCSKRIACSTAAGPAFEGGANRGIFGSDMVHLLAELKRAGVVDATGLLNETYFEHGIRIGNVCVTQEAIRSIQLAKAAIAAGVKLLLKEYGITEAEVDRVVLAGGFGYFLQPEDAAEIGLLPSALADKVVTGGNTVLRGAAGIGQQLLREQAALSDAAETEYQIYKRQVVSRVMKETEQVAGQTQSISLADESMFGEEFVAQMSLELQK